LRNFVKSRVTETDLTACPVRPDRERETEGAGVERCGRCVHGVCVEGACLCEADWFGEECDADVHDMEVYLPPSDPAGTWWACHQVAREPGQSRAEASRRDLKQCHVPCGSDWKRKSDAMAPPSSFLTRLEAIGIDAMACGSDWKR